MRGGSVVMSRQNNTVVDPNKRIEIVLGITAGVGVDSSHTSDFFLEIEKELKSQKCDYVVNYIKISDEISEFAKKIFPKKEKPLWDSVKKFGELYLKMQVGSFARKKAAADARKKAAAEKEQYRYPKAIWAKWVAGEIAKYRRKKNSKRVIHFISSLKHSEEVELLNKLYGKNFIQVALFEEEDERKKSLEEKISSKDRDTPSSFANICEPIDQKIFELMRSTADTKKKYDGDVKKYENNVADFLIQKDKKENFPGFEGVGQEIEKIFSKAHYFFDLSSGNLDEQIKRFIHLLFGHPFEEPKLDEIFMFEAESASLRSLDIDRQVGAALVKNGALLAVGYNDVAKPGGGYYTYTDKKGKKWDDDHRDYKKENDFNHNELENLSKEVCKIFGNDNLDKKKEVFDELSAITEFKRSTHAEMGALIDALRRGVSSQDATLYVNTFPCHNCTKHIIAAGIEEVVYLHPYPKSKADDMFGDMICCIGKNPSDADGKVQFRPFMGVAPNRFLYVFRHSAEERQQKNSQTEEKNGKPVKDWTPEKNKNIPPYLKNNFSDRTKWEKEFQKQYEKFKVDKKWP